MLIVTSSIFEAAIKYDVKMTDCPKVVYIFRILIKMELRLVI